jgi:hypothetical protein
MCENCVVATPPRAGTRRGRAGSGRAFKRRHESRTAGHRPLRPAVLAASALSAAVLSGCGEGGQTVQAQRLQSSSIVSNTTPLQDRLVKSSEIGSASDNDAVQTFLQFWSLLQFQAWDQAVELFQPGLRNTIGASLLAQALSQDLIVWQGTKPRIMSAATTGSTALIRFLARNEQDKVTPAAISFEGAPGSWRISYFSLLDGAMERAVQLRTQAQIEPLGTKAAPEAVRQGLAASRLQSTYLERHRSAVGPDAAGRGARRR